MAFPMSQVLTKSLVGATINLIKYSLWLAWSSFGRFPFFPSLGRVPLVGILVAVDTLILHEIHFFFVALNFGFAFSFSSVNELDIKP